MVKHFRAATLPLLAPVVAAVLVLAGCGAGGGSLHGALQPSDTWPVHNYEGAARAAAFAAVAVDSTEREVAPLTRQLHLDVRTEDGGTLVRILGREIDGLDRAYLHLRYDAAALHPELTRSGEWLPADTVFLGIANQPGLVVLGLQTTEGRRIIGDDVELAAVRFQTGGWTSQRGISAVSDSPVTDLHFDTTNTKQLVWSYTCTGDYDQNTEVGISDITPIGKHLKDTPASPDWAAAQCADGIADGEVNISDLQPIGANYHETVTGFQVKGGTSAAGPFTNDQVVQFNDALFPIPPAGGYRQFNYVVANAVDGNFYCVAAVSGAQESSVLSNAVQYVDGSGGNNPPQNLAAAQQGIAVQLTWQAPAGAAVPDGYNAYVSSDPAMAGAAKMNTGNGDIAALSFTCPLAVDPSGSYYFGVKAVYGGTESSYSNIFGYNISAGGPTNLTAVQAGSIIHLAWDPAPGTPDGYNAYVSSDPGMASPILMNAGPIATNAFDCPLAIDPGTEHYFAVKVIVSGSEAAQSNIAHYTTGGGGDTTPPVWQQGTGIKAATPDAAGDMVLVSWYVATDAQTPPVSYLLYVEPEGTPIDYMQPADVFASTILQTPVTTTRDGSPLVDGQRYQFAVRAVDAINVDPLQSNMTQNTNFLFATPQILPPTPTPVPSPNPVRSSDTASVRLPGEEVPRIIAVNHSDNLYYIKWDASIVPPNWQVTDLNATIGVAGRKYQPSIVAIDDEVHVLFATSNTVYEAYGPKDDPANWQLKVILTPIAASPAVQGTALCYSPSSSYLACIFAANAMGTEQLFYSDRDLTGEWSPPVAIMDGTPMFFQCDMAISEDNGEQFVVASNGNYTDTTNDKMFWYMFRPNRTDPWGTPTNSSFGSDVMSIAYDYTQDPAVPLVASATVRLIDLGIGQDAPITDATIYTWTGNAWASNVIEQGVAEFSGLEYHTYYAGQDSRLIFSPTSKAIALWSNIDVLVPDITADEWYFSGSWGYTQRPTTTWSPSQTLYTHLCSSNSVTAGDSFQHCVTCDLALVDGPLTAAESTDKYSDRSNYPEGELYYLYKPWS
jgi:hypothetical protein